MWSAREEMAICRNDYLLVCNRWFPLIVLNLAFNVIYRQYNSWVRRGVVCGETISGKLFLLQKNCILNWNWLFTQAEIQLRWMLWISAPLLLLVWTEDGVFKLFRCSGLLHPCRSCPGGGGQERLSLSQQHRPLLVTGRTTPFQHSGLWGQILWEGSLWLSLQSINRLRFFAHQIRKERGCRTSLPAVQPAL